MTEYKIFLSFVCPKCVTSFYIFADDLDKFFSINDFQSFINEKIQEHNARFHKSD